MLEEDATCKICGTRFVRQCTRGRRVCFCSDECRQVARRNTVNKYLKTRYYADADWRAHKRELNKASDKKRRSQRKDEALNRLADELVAAKTKEEIVEILNRSVRLKTELYN